MRPAKSRRSIGASVGCLIHLLYQIPGRLKFDREIEGGRGVYARDVDAGCVGAALVDVVVPETEATLIGHAIEKVDVLLLHKEIGVVNRNNLRWIGSRSHAQRLDLNTSIEKLRRQVGIVGDYTQSGTLPKNTDASQRDY